VGERIREGLTIVIAGPTNAGKSTLLNALSRREAAIVSPFAGTTRDPIEVHLDIEGCPVTLIDTAGLRESGDMVERIGVKRALEKAAQADLILWLSEADNPVAPSNEFKSRAVVWSIFTKIDKKGPQEAFSEPDLYLSAETGENLPLLEKRIGAFARSALAGGQGGLITRERHRYAFAKAAAGLRRVLDQEEMPIEFLAEDLRSVIKALEMLAGRVDVEDILGEIFARFCIGK
jgi:tRNA modification GTPase